MWLRARAITCLSWKGLLLITFINEGHCYIVPPLNGKSEKNLYSMIYLYSRRDLKRISYKPFKTQKLKIYVLSILFKASSFLPWLQKLFNIFYFDKIFEFGNLWCHHEA